MTKLLLRALAGASLIAAPLAAQTPAPAPVNTGAPALGAPLSLVSAGIAIPLGFLSDDHAAGYAVLGGVEYAVSGQPFSLRGELMYERYDAKQNRTGVNSANVFSLGANVLYRTLASGMHAYFTGGIGVTHATDNGTRPGLNGGTGVEFPLTDFTANAEARVRWVLTDGKPLLTLPLTIGVKF